MKIMIRRNPYRWFYLRRHRIRGRYCLDALEVCFFTIAFMFIRREMNLMEGHAYVSTFYTRALEPMGEAIIDLIKWDTVFFHYRNLPRQEMELSIPLFYDCYQEPKLGGSNHAKIN
jgi:hypothetical protein